MTIKLQQTSLQSAQDTLHKRYNVTSTLGRGRFAVVKKARHIVSGERVAVKIIDKTKLDSNSAERLYNEVEYLRLAKHASIVKLYEAIDTPENLYLILERADRGDLYDFIMDHSCVIEMTTLNSSCSQDEEDLLENEVEEDKMEGLTKIEKIEKMELENGKVERMQAGIGERLAKRFFKQIAEALYVCHTNNIVHRDLKPENVVIFTENLIREQNVQNQNTQNSHKLPQNIQQPQLPNHLHVKSEKNSTYSKNLQSSKSNNNNNNQRPPPLLSSSSSFSKNSNAYSNQHPVYLRAKITDFGFSNKFNPENQLLATSCGSLAYSAPEILLGDEYIAPAVDVWSLGVLLYMLVCGSAPFNEANDSETLTCIMDCKFTIPEYVSRHCHDLIRRMITLEATHRLSIQQILKHPWVTAEEKQENKKSRFAKNLRFVTKSGDIIDDSMLISNSWQSPMKHEIYEVFDRVKKINKNDDSPKNSENSKHGAFGHGEQITGIVGTGFVSDLAKLEYDDVEKVLLDSRLDEFSATCNLLLVNVRRTNRKKLLQMSRPQSVNDTCIRVTKSLEKSFSVARSSSPVPNEENNMMVTDENANLVNLEEMEDENDVLDEFQEKSTLKFEPRNSMSHEIPDFDGMDEVCNLEPAFSSAPCTPARNSHYKGELHGGGDNNLLNEPLCNDQILPGYRSSSSVHVPKVHSRSNSSSSVSSEFSIQSQHSEIQLKGGSIGQLSNNSLVDTIGGDRLVPDLKPWNHESGLHSGTHSGIHSGQISGNNTGQHTGNHTNSTSSRNNSSNNLLAEHVDVIMNDAPSAHNPHKHEKQHDKHGNASARSSSIRSSSQAASKRRLSGTTAVPQRESMTITPRKTVSENVKNILQKTLSSSSVSRDVQNLSVLASQEGGMPQDCEFNVCNTSYNSTPKNYSPIPPAGQLNDQLNRQLNTHLHDQINQLSNQNNLQAAAQVPTQNSSLHQVSNNSVQMPPPSYVPLNAHSRNSSFSSVSSVDTTNFQNQNRPLSPMHSLDSKLQKTGGPNRNQNSTTLANNHHHTGSHFMPSQPHQQGTTLHQITENTRQTSEEGDGENDEENVSDQDKIAELIEENAENIPHPPPIRNYRRITNLRHMHIISSSENSDGSDNDSRRTSSTNLASMYNKIRKSAGKSKSTGGGGGKSASFDHSFDRNSDRGSNDRGKSLNRQNNFDRANSDRQISDHKFLEKRQNSENQLSEFRQSDFETRKHENRNPENRNTENRHPENTLPFPHDHELESMIGTRAPLASEISSPGSFKDTGSLNSNQLNSQTPANSLGDIHENMPERSEYVNVDRLDGLHEVDQELEDEFVSSSSFNRNGYGNGGGYGNYNGGHGKIRSSTTSENCDVGRNNGNIASVNKTAINNNRSLSTSDLNATIRRRYNYTSSSQAVINYRARSAHSSFLRKNTGTPSASPAVQETLIPPVRSLSMSLLSKSVEEEDELKLKIMPSPSILDSTNDQFDKFLMELKHETGGLANSGLNSSGSTSSRSRPTIIPSNSLQSLPEHDTTPDVNRRRDKSSEKRNNSGNRGSSANRSGKIRDKIIEDQLPLKMNINQKLTENSSNKQNTTNQKSNITDANANKSNRHGLRHYSSSNLAAMAAAIRSSKLSSTPVVKVAKNRASNSLSTSLDQISHRPDVTSRGYSVAEINVDDDDDVDERIVIGDKLNVPNSNKITRSNSDKSVFKKLG